MSEQIADTASIIRRLRDGAPCTDSEGYPCGSREARAGCDCTIAADKIESDAMAIAALREALLDIGNLADKTLQDGENLFDRVVLRDIIFRCAQVIAPDITVPDNDADEQTAGECR
jgi:hypothetical protein